MKQLLIGVFSLVLASGAWAQKAKTAPAPDISFKVLEHDFGEVIEGEKPSFDFEFTNKGNAPLILTNVRASCGCTTPHWPREPIKPGDSAKITAVYNSKGRPGAFHKSITVQTNDPDERLVVLIIKGTVVRKGKAKGKTKSAPKPVQSPVRVR